MRRTSRIAPTFLLVLLTVLVLNASVPLPTLAQETAAATQDGRPDARANTPEIVTDRWYEIWLAGARTGWSHELVTRTGGTYTTRSQMRMEMARADASVEIRMESDFIETLEGEPVEVRVAQWLGPAPIRTRYRFGGDEVRVTSVQNGVEREGVLPPPPGEWLPPQAAGRYLAQRLAAGAEEITLRSLDATQGLVITTVTRTRFEPAETEVGGESVDCLRAETRTVVGPAQMPGREWLMRDGTVLRSEMSMGGMDFVLVASTRERALGDFEPPEMMVSTFVTPDRPIDDPRRTTRGVYRLSVAEGELPEIPASGFQRVEPLDNGSVRVTVNTDELGLADEVDRETYTAATTYADTQDELIQRLTREALERVGEDPAERAEALRRFVYRHIDDKGLATAFATASEVARSCQGDCSEHGVLLAAMLRAAEIPARVAVGVIYVEEFAGAGDAFGYHMWTQALLPTERGEAWVDLDATLPPNVPYDATHITLATSDLADGKTIMQLAGITPLLGALEITVEEAE